MNRADLWAGSTAPNAQPGNTEVRGMDTARLIAQRPSWIVVSRLVDGSTIQLPPQIVRLEVIQNPRNAVEPHDVMVTISKQYAEIVGYKDHPTIPDTNLLYADLVFYLNRVYEIIEIIDTVPGRLLASGVLTP